MHKVQNNNLGARISLEGTVINNPLEFSEYERTAFERLVKCGQEVQSQTLSELITEAAYLAFHYINNELVAIGAIKRPHESYKRYVFTAAGSDNSPADFIFELGWLYTEPNFRKRGISKDIVSQLLAKVPQKAIYATTRHVYIVSFLEKFGFIKSGSCYKSTRGDYKLALMIKTD